MWILSDVLEYLMDIANFHVDYTYDMYQCFCYSVMVIVTTQQRGGWLKQDPCATILS